MTTEAANLPSKKAAQREERVFLEGPQKRKWELLSVARMVREFVRGFRVLHFVGPCVTVFGSARFKEDHHYYIDTMKISGEIAKLGFTIMTGGGPGILEA